MSVYSCLSPLREKLNGDSPLKGGLVCCKDQSNWVVTLVFFLFCVSSRSCFLTLIIFFLHVEFIVYPALNQNDYRTTALWVLIGITMHFVHSMIL